MIRDELRSLNPKELRLVDSIREGLVQQLIQSRPTGHFLLKDAARKVGQGVSSYPVQRFYLLFEGPLASVEDDEIWEVKELSDQPPIPHSRTRPLRQFSSNGARIVHARRKAQWASDGALHHEFPITWIDIGNGSYRVRRLTALRRGLEIEDLLDQVREDPQSLQALAQLTGELLAGAHAFAPSIDGMIGGRILINDIYRVGEDHLFIETIEFCRRYGAQIKQDHDLFGEMIRTRGPLLGAQWASTDINLDTKLFEVGSLDE